ncbi:MAG: oligosaccharide flippase family protein [Bacteroidota bacterium]|nr:oligosaccharide flippase family protein [Bacteroidota bacterium]
MNIQKLLYQNVIWRGLFYLVTFVLNIVIARHFESGLTGVLYYLVNVYAFITLIASVSLEAGIIYFASSKKILPSSLFTFAIMWTALVAFVMTALFILLTLFHVIEIEKDVFIYAVIFISGNLLITFLNSLYYAKSKFILPNVTGILINCLLLVLIFFVSDNYWLNNDKYFFIYFFSFLLQGIVLAVVFFINSDEIYKLRLPSVSQLKMLFNYCLLAFTSNVITFLFYRVDYWFVHHYRSAEDLGNYIQVSKITQMFFVLPGILASAVFPLTASGRRQEINDLLKIASRTIFFLYGVACIFLALTGKWLFPFIFGETFNRMYIPFLFLIPGILALSTLYTLTAYYAGKNRVMVSVKGSFLALIIIVTGDALFIPAYGILAAAAVSSLGYIAYHVFILSIFSKEYKTSINGFYIFKFSDISRMKKSILRNIN